MADLGRIPPPGPLSDFLLLLRNDGGDGSSLFKLDFDDLPLSFFETAFFRLRSEASLLY